MSRYIAFLRGINVGGRTRVPMAELRVALTGLGYTDVATLLNSGNAVFTAAEQAPVALERALEKQLNTTFDLPVRCVVRTADELADVVARDPFAGVATDGAKYVVTFLSEAADPVKVAAINPDDYLPEEFRVSGREIYLWCPDGLRDTKFGNVFFEKKLGVVATARNWNTVQKALALARV